MKKNHFVVFHIALLTMVWVFDLDAVFFDGFFGSYSFKESGIDISSEFFAFSLIYPDSFEIGRSFFIAPIVGAGYYHNTTTTKISGHSEKNKSGAFDFLLSPKAGFIISNYSKIFRKKTSNFDRLNELKIKLLNLSKHRTNM